MELNDSFCIRRFDTAQSECPTNFNSARIVDIIEFMH